MQLQPLYQASLQFLKISQELMMPVYYDVARKFQRIMVRFMNRQKENEEGYIHSVGQVREVGPLKFEFTATVFRDLEREMNGEKFPGFSNLVKELSGYLGKPMERTDSSAAWETIKPEGDSIRISMTAGETGSEETHSIKIIVSPLRDGSLSSEV